VVNDLWICGSVVGGAPTEEPGQNTPFLLTAIAHSRQQQLVARGVYIYGHHTWVVARGDWRLARGPWLMPMPRPMLMLMRVGEARPFLDGL
jgi:hypothetical protein